MKHTENFVTFNVKGMNHTEDLVNLLISESLSLMNEKVSKNPKKYNKMSGSDVEAFSYNSMLEIAPSINFPKERIQLISGHIFPDIILKESHYGVEIKSTQKDAWTSTGSSIVESTRDINTDYIYMLFGKLGGIPEFRCKPYEQCLSNIAVTHSPRFLIDMSLNEEDNIFAKMETEYDVFRKMEEKTKIDKVRQYYIQKARREKKSEMPWWMGSSTNIYLSFYNDLSPLQKSNIQARASILFRCLYSKNKRDRYKPISLWLCNNYSLLCPNMRDDFSAGGQCFKINGKLLTKPYPHFVGELLRNHELIKKILNDPDEDIIRGINDFWDFQYNKNDLYNSWLDMIEDCFKNNPELRFIPIRHLLTSGATAE